MKKTLFALALVAFSVLGTTSCTKQKTTTPPQTEEGSGSTGVSPGVEEDTTRTEPIK